MPVTQAKPTRPPVLYTGANECDFRPELYGLAEQGAALAETCFAAMIGDHLPWLVLADWLDERGDPRGWWVREFVRWEEFAQAGRFGRVQAVAWEDRQNSFAEHTKTVSGWRWVGLWNAIAARWCPDGYGVGPQLETWTDELVRATNVWCVLWACGLVNHIQADAAGSQAYAAGSQAYAAGSQVYAAGSQAYAAWRQADAAGSQAYAAGSQVYAAWSQAYAAWGQAYAAWSQAYAAGRQAYAAWRQAYAAWRQADAAEDKCRKWMMGFWAVMAAGAPNTTTEG